MRSYDQYCAVARALDIVGDRWALLVVRELLLRRRCRYKDLQDGLPGISTNVLTERLRDLVDAGVVRRVDPSPPIARPLYELTARGTELAPVLHALGTWGAALMAAPQGDDAFRGHWLAFPISRLAGSAAHDPHPPRPPPAPPPALPPQPSGGFGAERPTRHRPDPRRRRADRGRDGPRSCPCQPRPRDSGRRRPGGPARSRTRGAARGVAPRQSRSLRGPGRRRRQGPRSVGAGHDEPCREHSPPPPTEDV